MGRCVGMALFASWVASLLIGAASDKATHAALPSFEKDTAAASSLRGDAPEGRPLARGLLGTLTAEPTNPSPSGRGVLQDPLKEKSSQVVGGIVEAFLHKQELEQGELDCLVEGTGELAGSLMSLSSHTVMLLQQILKGDEQPSAPAATSPQINDAAIDDGASSISAKVDAMAAAADRGGAGGGDGAQGPRSESTATLVVTIVGARDLRNADWAPGQGKSDPYCVCELAGKPGSKVTTLAYSDRLDVTWNHAAKIAGYAEGDSLLCTVRDKDPFITDDLLGRATLKSSQFYPDGFEGELPLSDAGDGVRAYLSVKVAVISEEGPTGAAGDASGEDVGLFPRPPVEASSGPSSSPQTDEGKSAEDSLAVFYNDQRRLEKVPRITPAVAMSASLVFVELGTSLQRIAELSHRIVRKCVQGDALQAFRLAGQRVRHVQDLGGHFLSNGGDIVSELADAVTAFEHHRMREFGQDIGTAFRKVLLSNSTQPTLPEGLPGKYALANVTSGLVDGVFGRGMAVDVESALSNSPVHVDLHQCMAENLQFFQMVWSSTMIFFAKESVKTKKHKMEKVHLGTALALTMMRLPAALKKCNINRDQEQMLMDSIKALGNGTSIHFTTPLHHIDKDEVAMWMAETCKAWSKMEWYSFGHNLGKLLQALVTVVFPQKYAVDDNGALRMQIVQATEAGSVVRPQTMLGGSLRSPATVILAAPLALGAVMLLRTRRTWASCLGGARDAAVDPADAELCAVE